MASLNMQVGILDKYPQLLAIARFRDVAETPQLKAGGFAPCQRSVQNGLERCIGVSEQVRIANLTHDHNSNATPIFVHDHMAEKVVSCLKVPPCSCLHFHFSPSPLASPNTDSKCNRNNRQARPCQLAWGPLVEGSHLQ